MKKLKPLLKKYSIFVVLFVVVVIIVLGHFMNKNIKLEVSEIEVQIEGKFRQIQEYEREPEKAPSPALVRRLGNDREVLMSNFGYLKGKFSTSRPAAPQFKDYPAIEYQEYIYFSKDRLQRMAQMRNVQLPTVLPFRTEGLLNLSENEIGTLTKQFEIVKDLVALVIDSGVTRINDIKPGAPKQEDFYSVLPIQLILTGTSNEIMRFLQYVEFPSSYFLVKSFAIDLVDSNNFKLEVGLEAIIIEEDAVDANQTL